MGCGVHGMGCGELTAISHTKVTAVHLRTYYKLTRARLKLFSYSRDAARKNILGTWEALLKRGRSHRIRKRAPRNGHHHPTHKGHLRLPLNDKVLNLRNVQFVNRLRSPTGFC